MIKCKDCKYAEEITPTLIQCQFPLPDWLISGPTGGGFVNSDAERNCNVFVSKTPAEGLNDD